jgi:hypothetical protein
MKLHLASVSFTFACAIILVGCAPYQPGGDMHSRICNELNTRIIFNGNTSDTRKSEIETSDQPLNERTYINNDCG